MNFLNNYPIKYRVLILVVIPLIGIIILSGFKVSEKLQTYSTLATINENLTSGNLLLSHNIEAKSLATNVTTSSLASGDIDENNLKFQQEALVTLKNLETTLTEHAPNLFLPPSFSPDNTEQLAQTEKYKETILTLSELTQSFSEFDSSEISDWYSEVVDTENELIKWLEKYHLRSGIKSIDKNLYVILELRWVMFWASQENWYSTLILNDSETIIDDDIFNNHVNLINQYANKQELFLDRFLSMSANEKQIKLMLDIFNSDAFILTAEFRDKLTEDSFTLTPLKRDQFRAAFEERLALTLSVSETIAKQISADIKTESSNAVSLITFILISLLIAISLISLLGFNVSTRIFKYLKNTLATLSIIEEKKDYSLTLSTKGNDELTTFSKTLNNLIDERRIHDNNLVQAKKDADKANQAKSFFLANMSHEIRTPLNGILGMNTILKETPLSSSQKNHLSIIDQSSKTLLYLINDILDISKIESGNFDINPEPTDFRELIYNTTALVMSKASEKALELNINFTSQTPAMINVDGQRLRQVLMNLLSNAVKFTAQGLVQLSVNCVQNNEGVWTLSFEVTDSGIGISESNQKIIFDAFVQADGSITREFGGTGLGLAISAQLVKLMHGEIICSSEEGKGSKFSFTIECNEATQDEEIIVDEQVQLLPVYLISNNTIEEGGTSQHSGIIGELNSLKNTSYLLLNTIDELPETIDNNAFIFYFHTSLVATKNDLEKLVAKFDKNKILLFQKTSDDPADYRDYVLGQVSLPILGSSFLEILKDGINNVPSDIKNITSDKECHENKVKTNDVGDDKKEDDDEAIKILIVEDNLINQKVTSLYLKTMGYQFEIADNGQIAVDKIVSGETYNLILMDCMMPVMDGFNASINIREHEAHNKLPRTPIIALTASIFKEDIERCYASHMDGYLPKPVDKAILHKELKAYLAKGKS